jgi:hypothetical protein
MRYFADAIIGNCIRGDQSPLIFRVLKSPGDLVPIGVAREVEKVAQDEIAWSIRIRGVVVPGRFVVVDGEFVPIDLSVH